MQAEAEEAWWNPPSDAAANRRLSEFDYPASVTHRPTRRNLAKLCSAWANQRMQKVTSSPPARQNGRPEQAGLVICQKPQVRWRSASRHFEL